MGFSTLEALGQKGESVSRPACSHESFRLQITGGQGYLCSQHSALDGVYWSVTVTLALASWQWETEHHGQVILPKAFISYNNDNHLVIFLTPAIFLVLVT